jgi:hypothetical protein
MKKSFAFAKKMLKKILWFQPEGQSTWPKGQVRASSSLPQR